ncbi:MAG: glucose-6-phosphate isomerase [Alphaproteobacteria bacterium]|nr:glucose-6-phosphate isomerase [Alphaproteobacteria bacterium]
MTLFTQDLSLCTGATAVNKRLAEAYEKRVHETHKALDWLANSPDRSLQAVKAALNDESDVAAAREVAGHLSNNTSDLIVLGVGGSSLGAQALGQIAYWGTQAYQPRQGTPRVHFLDNLDGSTFASLLANCDLRTTRFLCVSKSGGTVETLMQTMAAIEAIENAGGGKYLKFHFAGITENKNNPLRNILEHIQAPILVHDANLGGRFSVFSTVGLLPAIVMGLDPMAIRAAAKQTFDTEVAAEKSLPPAAQGAALSVAACDVGLSQSILWPYSDRLWLLAQWWRQLWGESLGKHGRGTTPIASLGPVDQHSQLQLYLEGPADKLFTFIDAPYESQDARIGPKWAREHNLDLYAGHTLGEVNRAELQASAKVLAGHGRPVRMLRLVADLDERAMGSLMMHFMLETLIAAKLWDVDPFGQPAVEEGKRLTREYLDAKA